MVFGDEMGGSFVMCDERYNGLYITFCHFLDFEISKYVLSVHTAYSYATSKREACCEPSGGPQCVKLEIYIGRWCLQMLAISQLVDIIEICLLH